MPADSFPRRYARTQRFTLGAPRDFRVAADGTRVTFLRSRSETDPVTCLWAIDLPEGIEQLVVDPIVLGADGDGELPAAERARRERAREGASGIVAYDTDENLETAVFTLEGRLFAAQVATGVVEELAASAGVFDPRLSPDGRRISYVAGRTLRLTDRAGSDRLVAAEDEPTVSWGSAEFVAGEEMGRTRGHWWSPQSDALLVERADVASVAEWWVSAPAAPWRTPTPMRYPAAGTANASVELAVIRLDGRRVAVDWRRGEFEYLASAEWSPNRHPTLVVQTRSQQVLAVLDVDPETGATTEIHREVDPSWVELTPGAPIRRWDAVHVLADREGSRRLLRNGEPLTPPGLEVRSLVSVTESCAIVTASPEPTETHVYRVDFDGRVGALTGKGGVHACVAGGDVVVTVGRSLQASGSRTEIRPASGAAIPVASHAGDPGLTPNVEILALGGRKLATALILPRNHDASPLPVLLDPYGGPHAQRVVRSHDAFLVPQWFADQGFAVVVIDGRGTPGRGTEWERAIHGDLAAPVLADQVDALYALAAERPELDLSRVAIRGWSFGGYLAALAVLRRPDVFHAAIAGAPVTDWRLYDTHYTERYLGNPGEDDAPYERCDLVAEAAELRRPLLLIHGLADDNVVAAHTLRLSEALLAAGRPHQVLPLSDVSHMTPQDVVAENVLILQLEFLRNTLGVVDAPEDGRTDQTAGAGLGM